MVTFVTPADFAALLPGASEELVVVVARLVTDYALAEVPALSGSLTDEQADLIRSVLIPAVRRYIDAGDGTVTYSQAPGGYAQSVDATAMRRGGMLYARELDTLRRIVGSTPVRDARRAIVLGPVTP